MMTDERTRKGGRLVEEFPFLAEPDFRAPWDLEPRPPFRLQCHHETGRPDRMKHEIWQTFELAVWRFMECFIPPEPGMAAYVMDESFRVILGWNAWSGPLMRDQHPAWYGVRAAFAWLEESDRLDRMDLAVWESMAAELAT